MKTSIIALLSGLVVLASCSNNQKTGEVKTSDTVSTVDTIKQTDTVKKDTVATQAPKKKQSEEDRDMEIMNNILKKKKKIQ
jgi:uncharacterized lipoprotein YajG